MLWIAFPTRSGDGSAISWDMIQIVEPIILNSGSPNRQREVLEDHRDESMMSERWLGIEKNGKVWRKHMFDISLNQINSICRSWKMWMKFCSKIYLVNVSVWCVNGLYQTYMLKMVTIQNWISSHMGSTKPFYNNISNRPIQARQLLYWTLFCRMSFISANFI